jgi:hypothetical protein
VQADIVSDLFKCASVAKRAYGVNPRAHAAPGEAGRNRNHVLLGDAHVNKSLSQPIAQWLQGIEAQITGQETKSGV